MGRKRSIDREAILDSAEALVTEEGAGQLTFDALARRTGISKGGILYCYPSKQALIAAMARRDLLRFTAEAEEAAARRGFENPEGLAAHVAATRAESVAVSRRAASLMAALAEMPDEMSEVRRHYRGLFDKAAPERHGGAVQARLALLACEGAFLLRGLGLLPMDEAEWSAVFDDIEALAAEGPDRSAP